MTVTTEGTASTLELLKAGACSAACLLSAEAGRCGCRCGGTHHGELLATLAALAGQAGEHTSADASSPAPSKARAARRSAA